MCRRRSAMGRRSRSSAVKANATQPNPGSIDSACSPNPKLPCAGCRILSFRPHSRTRRALIVPRVVHRGVLQQSTNHRIPGATTGWCRWRSRPVRWRHRCPPRGRCGRPARGFGALLGLTAPTRSASVDCDGVVQEGLAVSAELSWVRVRHEAVVAGGFDDPGGSFSRSATRSVSPDWIPSGQATSEMTGCSPASLGNGWSTCPVLRPCSSIQVQISAMIASYAASSCAEPSSTATLTGGMSSPVITCCVLCQREHIGRVESQRVNPSHQRGERLVAQQVVGDARDRRDDLRRGDWRRAAATIARSSPVTSTMSSRAARASDGWPRRSPPGT